MNYFNKPSSRTVILFYTTLEFLLNCSWMITGDVTEINTISTQNTVLSNQNLTEQYFIKYILSDTREDPICSLTKKKKIALCQKIFQLLRFRNMPIQLNTVAFFINKLSCERKLIEFISSIFFLDETLWQDMYPCYGRHDPVGTNYKSDTYYDKFYISSGLIEDKNAVIVYVHKYNSRSDWFNVYGSYANIDLLTLEDLVIDVKNVEKELKLEDNTALVTNDQVLLEYIFLREMHIGTDEKDPVCELEHWRKTALCQNILNQDLYKMMFDIKLNKNAFSHFSPLVCTKGYVVIRFDKYHRNRRLPQHFYPCFGQSRLKQGGSNFLRYPHITRIYLSTGPRDNSVFVYYREKSYFGDKFYPIQLIENICINCTQVNEITKENLIEESIDAYNVATIIQNSLSLRGLNNETRMDLIKKIISRDIAIRQVIESAEYLTNFSSKGKISNKINVAFNIIKSIILSMVIEEESLKISLENQKVYNNLLLNYENAEQYVEETAQYVFKIFLRNSEIEKERSVMFDKYDRAILEKLFSILKNEHNVELLTITDPRILQ